jgi:heme/copper-type cytochrome/quinol oxidase subunit 2
VKTIRHSKRLSLSNKRGNIELTKFIATALVSFMLIGMVALFVYLFNSTFFENFNATGYNTTDTAKVEGSIIGSLKMIDLVMVILIIVSLISVGVYEYRHPEDPIGFIITFFVAPFLGFMAYVFNYIFYQYAFSGSFSSVVNYYPNTIIILTNMHWLALAMLIIGSFAIYSQKRSGRFTG